MYEGRTGRKPLLFDEEEGTFSTLHDEAALPVKTSKLSYPHMLLISLFYSLSTWIFGVEVSHRQEEKYILSIATTALHWSHDSEYWVL